MQKIDTIKFNSFLANLDDHYQSFIEETIDYLEESYPIRILQEGIRDQIISILIVEKNSTFDTLRFFWFQKLQDLLYIGELLHATQNCSTEQEVLENIDDIKAFWTTLGFGIPYDTNLETDTEKTSKDLFGIFEQQLISFFYLHINQDIELPHPSLYFPVEEMTEDHKALHIGLKQYVNIEGTLLPLIISHLTDTTLHLNGDIEELAVSTTKSSHLISSKIYDSIQKIPAVFPLWNKTILGFNTQIPISIFTPMLSVTNEDSAKKIFSQFALYIVNLYELLSDDEWNEQQDEQQLQKIKENTASSWLKWLYEEEEKNSYLIF